MVELVLRLRGAEIRGYIHRHDVKRTTLQSTAVYKYWAIRSNCGLLTRIRSDCMSYSHAQSRPNASLNAKVRNQTIGEVRSEARECGCV